MTIEHPVSGKMRMDPFLKYFLIQYINPWRATLLLAAGIMITLSTGKLSAQEPVALGGENNNRIIKGLIDDSGSEPILYILSRRDGAKVVTSKNPVTGEINWSTELTTIPPIARTRDMVLKSDGNGVLVLSNQENTPAAYLNSVAQSGEVTDVKRITLPNRARNCKIVNSGDNYLLHTTRDLSAFMLDPDLNLLWARSYSVTGWTQQHESRPDGDGGAFLFRNNGAAYSPDILNIDSLGAYKHILNINFNQHLYSQIQDVIPDGNGNWIVLGFRNNNGANNTSTGNQENYTGILFSVNPSNAEVNWQKEMRLGDQSIVADGWRGDLQQRADTLYTTFATNTRISDITDTTFIFKKHLFTGELIGAYKSSYKNNGQGRFINSDSMLLVLDNYFEQSESDVLIDNGFKLDQSCNFVPADIRLVDGNYLSASLVNYGSVSSGATLFDQTIQYVETELELYPTCCVEVVERDTFHLCKGEEFNGMPVVSDTTITEVITGPDGCDSIFHQFINVFETAEESRDTISICQGEEIEGIQIHSDTTIITTFENINGCDSIAQIVVLVDSSGFTGFSNARDTTLTSQIASCDSAYIEFTAALEFCGFSNYTPEELTSWKLDLFQSGTFEISSDQPRPDQSLRSGLSLEEHLPFGVHLLQWTFESPGGEVFTEQHLITVVDRDPPTPVCMHGISSSVHPVTASVTLPATIWDMGSWDHCSDSEDLIISFSSDPNHTHHTWTCDDLHGAKERTIPIEIWVTDTSGHQQFCRTYLFLKDNYDTCQDTATITQTISGSVLNPASQVPGEVQIKAIDPTGLTFAALTDGQGQFKLELPSEKDWVLSGEKTGSSQAGISTFDILIIQKHILGLQTLDSPWKRIAADVNSDGQINVLDIRSLRSALLGNDGTTASFEPWKIIPDQPLEQDTEVPSYKKDIAIGQHDSNVRLHDFIALKTGSVSGSYWNAGDRSSESRHASNTVEFLVEEKRQGEMVHFNFYLEEPRSINGFQASIKFPGKLLAFEEINSGLIPISHENCGLNRLSEGILSLSWSRADEVISIPGKPLFTLTFWAKTGQNSPVNIHLATDHLTPEIYKTSEARPLALKYLAAETASADLELYPIRPNPFSTRTQIPFHLKQPSSVSLTVFTPAGKRVFSDEIEAVPGENYFTLKGSLLPGTGLYFFEIRSDNSRKMGTLIKF